MCLMLVFTAVFQDLEYACDLIVYLHPFVFKAIQQPPLIKTNKSK